MSDPNVTPEPTAEPTPQPQPTEPTPSEPTQPTEPVKQWYEQVFTDEQLQADDTIKKYKSADDFGKAFKEKDSMIGRKGVILPNEKDQNDVERFYKQLGRPDEATQYNNPEIQVEEEFKKFVSEDKLNKFKDVAHKYGLTQKQFEGISKEYTEFQLEEVKSIVHNENKRLEESTRKLMNDWVVDYDANSKSAEMALKSFAQGISQDKLDMLLNDPDIKRLGFNIAKSVSEDTYKRSDGSKVETTESLQSFIDSQVKDSNSPYYNQSSPDHKAARQKVKDAYSRLADMRKAVA